MIYIDSTIVVAMDKLIQRRVNMDRMLKNQLEGTRNMMKHMANRNRPKYEFTERDYVSSKLKPYRHGSVSIRKNFKSLKKLEL